MMMKMHILCERHDGNQDSKKSFSKFLAPLELALTAGMATSSVS